MAGFVLMQIKMTNEKGASDGSRRITSYLSDVHSGTRVNVTLTLRFSADLNLIFLVVRP